MTDVRLVALNPEDSKVYPVACNSSGEILTDKVSVGPDISIDGDLDVAGKTGLGTDKPLTSLHVKSQSASATSTILETANSQSLINFKSESTEAFYIGTTGDNWNVQTSAKQRLAVTSTGRVGVNTDQPQSVLDVEGDVILKSRDKKYMIVAQNGLAHLVEQEVLLGLNPDLGSDPGSDVIDPVETIYPELRNIPGELTLVEEALGQIFEKLRMSPPAGWPVWDGSDNS